VTTFKVEGIHCDHCVAAIKKAVRDADPAVASVEVDPARGEVKVEPSADQAAIAAAIQQAGYEVTGVL